MTGPRTTILVLALGAALAGLLASDAVTVGTGPKTDAPDIVRLRPNFIPAQWPFLRDQWGDGRAFRCVASDCGVNIDLYLRPKIGFCNCDTGVSDDAELDRVGDLELFSDRFVALGDGRAIKVGWMTGRSRPYRVEVPYSQARTAQVIAFNQSCDVMVATVVAPLDRLADADRFALEFLNGDTVLGWAKSIFGDG